MIKELQLYYNAFVEAQKQLEDKAHEVGYLRDRCNNLRRDIRSRLHPAGHVVIVRNPLDGEKVALASRKNGVLIRTVEKDLT